MAILGMETAKRFGLEVCVSMTIGSHNVNEVESMAAFAKKNGYNFLTHFIMPTGKGVKFLENNPIENSTSRWIASQGV